MLPLPRRKADLPNFPDWHSRGMCFGTEADVFFPPDKNGALWETEAAKDARHFFCNHCPVYVQCLESALLHGDTGIWAGTTTLQRDQLRRKRNRAKCPICKNKKLISVQNHWLCLACGVSWERGEENQEGSG